MYGVTRIDVCEEVTLISFNNIPLDTPLLSDIFTGFAQADIVIDMISQAAPIGDKIHISFSCMDSDMVKVLALSKELQAKYPGMKPLVTSGNCKLQLYGEEMRHTPGVFAKMLSALSGLEEAVELKQITTSEVDISLLVLESQREDVLRVLKLAFEIA